MSGKRCKKLNVLIELWKSIFVSYFRNRDPGVLHRNKFEPLRINLEILNMVQSNSLYPYLFHL